MFSNDKQVDLPQILNNLNCNKIEAPKNRDSKEMN